MKRVLFVCNHNAGRSQMCEAFWRKHGPGDIWPESAGTSPAEAVWPEVVQVMAEVGVDLADQVPRKLSMEVQLRADYAVTMGCGDVCPYVPAPVEDWDIPDPAGRPLDEVRAIRDGIEQRVIALIDSQAQRIRDEDYSLQRILGQVVPSVAAEFEGRRDPVEIRACASAILNEFADAPVRSFVVTLVTRRLRDCLQGEGCEVLAAS
jgi:arsenate reductase (thioredoxin)